jgi:hypothetical protein
MQNKDIRGVEPVELDGVAWNCCDEKSEIKNGHFGHFGLSIRLRVVEHWKQVQVLQQEQGEVTVQV